MKTIKLAQSNSTISATSDISIYGGDTITFILSNLPISYDGKTAYLVMKKGQVTQDLSDMPNVLPAFTSTSNLTQVLNVDANGNANITLEPRQTVGLKEQKTYVLEIEIRPDSNTIDTYGQYNIYNQQNLNIGIAPADPYVGASFNSDNITQGTTNLFVTPTEKAKLALNPALINDTTPSTSTVYSSTKTVNLLSNKADLIGGLVPSSQLPSYVDDILEFANLASFPVTGETGKLYLALDTSKLYRWTGSAYFALPSGGAVIDDIVPSSTTVYSSTKINLETAKINNSSKNNYITDRVIVGAHFPGYSGSGNTTPALLTQLETDCIGANNLGALLFKQVNNNGTYTNSDFAPVKDILDSGRVCVYNLEPMGTLAQINNGNFDTAFNQFNTIVNNYVTTNPNFYIGQLLVKFMHEGNLSVGAYPWVVYDPANLGTTFNKFTTPKATIDTAINNFKTGFVRLANLLNNVNILRVLELGCDNWSGAWTNLDDFYPASGYEVVAVNRYNRYGISSGYGYSSPFGDNITAWLESADRKAPNLPKMIGEVSSTALSVVNPLGTVANIVSGGSGFPASVSNQALPSTAVTHNGATAPQFTYTTNSSGVITAIGLVNKGRDLTSCTIASNFDGGTGANITINLRQTGINKAEWIKDTFEFVKNRTDIRYLFWFLEDKPVSPTDNRDWSLNIQADRNSFGLGCVTVNDRVALPNISTKTSPNLCLDPQTKTLSNWNASGGNVGTLSLTTLATNLPPYDRQITSAVRLSHSATAGTFDSRPFSNRLGYLIPYWNGSGSWNNGYQPNEPLTIEFDALFKPFGNPTSYRAPLLVAIEDFVNNNYERSMPPQFLLQKQYKRFRVCTSNGQASTGGFNVFFGIGQADTSGELILTNVSFRIGSNLIPLDLLTSTTGATINDSTASLTTVYSSTKTDVQIQNSANFLKRYALIH